MSLPLSLEDHLGKSGTCRVLFGSAWHVVTPPSALLISRFADAYGVDVYALNYCTGEDDSLPERVKQARRKLVEALQLQLAATIKTG
jgi:hypothetical protein